MGQLISDTEALSIIDFGKARGWTQQQCLAVVSERDYELKLAAAKTAEAKRIAEETEKARKEALLVEETIKGEKEVDPTTGETTTPGVEIETDLSTRLDKISETGQTKWEKNTGTGWLGGGRTSVSGGLLDQRDDKFVVGTLGREYGDLGFSFEDVGDDKIQAYYTDSSGKKHKSEVIITNQVDWWSAGADEAQAHILEGWMKEAYQADHVKGTDYRAVKIEGADTPTSQDDKYEWHYTDGDESLGKVTSDIIINKLDKKQPNALDPLRYRSYKYDSNGQLLYNERYGDDESWKPVTDETERIDHEILYPNAKQDAVDRKEGEESQIYSNSILGDKSGDLKTVKDREIHEKNIKED